MTTISKENTTPEVNEAVSSEPMFTKKDLRKMCWRSLPGGFSVNWDRYVHKTFTFMIAPMLKRIYKNDHEGYVKALQRNMEFFNITPQVHAFMGGLTVAMEEQNAKDPNFDPKTINSVKAALMGPLSGIGDSFFWGTFRVITAGIGIAFAQQGSILGALLYFFLYTAIHFLTKYITGNAGYKMGTRFLENSAENHLIEKMSYGASILGLTVIGAMIGTMVTLKTSLTFQFSGTETTLQSIFDQIFPGLLPLGATFLCVWLFNRNVKTIAIILGIFVIF